MSEAILRRAAFLLGGADNYTRHPVDSVFDPHATMFCATGLLERANTRPPCGESGFACRAERAAG